MTFREAIGGPWAFHWALWLALAVPATLLVVLRESVTPFADWWWPLVSAIAQHAVATAVVLLGSVIARRRHAIIPLVTVLLLWMLASVLRGFVGGTVAAVVAEVDPEYASRIAFWVVISLAWLPVSIYVVAQFQHRRLILGAIDVVQFELAQQSRLTDSNGTGMQRQLRQAIAESLAPALHDLNESLIASRRTLDLASVAEVSLRVSQLHDDVADLAESARDSIQTPPGSQAPISRAVDIAPRRPWLNALLVGLTTAVLIIGDAWRVFGPLAALEVVVSITVASTVLGAVPAAVAAIRPEAPARYGQRVSAAATMLAVVVAVVLMLNSGIDPITWHGLLIVPLLALSLVVSSAMWFSAIVLADANRAAAAQLTVVDAELEKLRASNALNLEREGRRLSDLMHGPVQGRIAACVMALNFSASSPEAGEPNRFLTESVLDHLRAVSRDLAAITADVESASP